MSLMIVLGPPIRSYFLRLWLWTYFSCVLITNVNMESEWDMANLVFSMPDPYILTNGQNGRGNLSAFIIHLDFPKKANRDKSVHCYNV